MRLGRSRPRGPQPGDIEFLAWQNRQARERLEAAIPRADARWAELTQPLVDEVNQRRLDNLTYQVMLGRRWRRWERQVRPKTAER